MFMDEGKAARPLPCESIIKEVTEVKKAREVKEGTQGNSQIRGEAEKMC
jgi:hypothetical protein